MCSMKCMTIQFPDNSKWRNHSQNPFFNAFKVLQSEALRRISEKKDSDFGAVKIGTLGNLVNGNNFLT